jgi:hypothetical protein
MDGAEEVVAEIWRLLELYDIPSPKMKFDFPEPSIVCLSFDFNESAWAEIVSRHLSGWHGSLATRPSIRPIAANRARAARVIPKASGRIPLLSKLR